MNTEQYSYISPHPYMKFCIGHLEFLPCWINLARIPYLSLREAPPLLKPIDAIHLLMIPIGRYCFQRFQNIYSDIDSRVLSSTRPYQALEWQMILKVGQSGAPTRCSAVAYWQCGQKRANNPLSLFSLPVIALTVTHSGWHSSSYQII